MLRSIIFTLTLTAALFATGVFAPAEAVTLSNDRVFAYAEANYPTLFPGTAADQQFQQYTYRYYPATANYLAVDTANDIFRLGPDTGNVITNVGTVASFADAIIAWEALSAGVTTQNGVTATGLGESIAVSWTNTCTVCSWQLSTRQGNGPWIIQAVLPKGSTQYTINDLLPGQKYLVKMAEKRAARWVDRALLTATTRPIVAGPLVYELVESRLRGLGQTGMGSSPWWYANAINGFVAELIPETSVAIGIITNIANLFPGNQLAEMQQEINQLTAEVSQMQTQINNIETILSLDQNIFYLYTQAQAAIIAQIWFYGYQTSFNAIQGADGAYSQFLVNIGVPTTGQWPSTTTYATLAANSAIMTKLNTVATPGTTAYMANLQNLSTAVVPVGCTACYKNTVQTKLAGVGSENSATMQVFDALYEQLQTYVPIPGTATANNFTTVLEAYNNELMSIYQQNIAALQTAYTVEASENYLNYINGQNNGGTNQIAGIEDIPEITYTFSNQSLVTEQQNLTNAQVKLTLLYAARINQLYNTTLQYIVSDQPGASFTLPTPPTFTSASVNSYIAAHPYKSFIAQTKPSLKIVGTLGQPMPTVAGSPSLFYQYDALNQIYLCVYNLQAGQPSTSISCPLLLPGATGATWNGINFSIYSSLSSPMQLSPSFNIPPLNCSNSPIGLSLWYLSGWGYQLQCASASSNPTPLPGDASNNSVTAEFSQTDPNADYYFNVSTASTLFNTWQSRGSPLALVNGQYKIATDKTQIAAQGGASWGWFGGTFTYTGPNGYIGQYVLGGTGQQDPVRIHWVMPITCTGSMCYIYANGICLGGNYISATAASGNTMNVENQGWCPAP